MTARVHVVADHAYDAVAIYLTVSRGDGIRAFAEPVDLVMRDVSDGEVAAIQPPTMRLPEHVARALLDGLCAHFGGTTEVLTARRDLQAANARTDRLIDALITCATSAQRGDGRG